jgi:hypothetical protein
VRFVLIVLAINAISYGAPPCVVTRVPSRVFVPPPPYAASPDENSFYLGSDDFWTILPKNGIWEPRKNAWFSKDYWWRSGEEQNLRVDARKLDGGPESVHAGRATNAFLPERQASFMINSIDLPSGGCWEIHAAWHGHELTFVAWVTPNTASSN